MARKRLGLRYERMERNIRRVVYVYDDGSEEASGFEVRVGGKRMGMHANITNARKVRDKARVDLEHGTLVAPSAGDATFKSVAETWLAGSQVARLKPSTRAGYVSIAMYRLGPLHDYKVRRVTAGVIDALLGGLTRDGLSPLTVRKIRSVIQFVLETARRDHLIAHNPCLEVAKPKAHSKPISVPEMEDVETLLDSLAALNHPRAREWALYAEVAAYAGLRAGEITGLRVRCVDVLRRAIRVEETVVDLNGKTVVGSPKSDAGHRTVTELPRDLVQRLAAHVQGKALNDYVFGDGLTPMRHKNYYRRVFLPTAKAVGLTTLRFHDLRHFYASDLLRDPQLSIKDVSTRMGHADATLVLRTYGHLFADSGAGLGDRVAERREAARAKAAAEAAKVVQFG